MALCGYNVLPINTTEKEMNDQIHAFPTMLYAHGGESDGMTLRDYFAAKAMQGMQARVNWGLEEVAKIAYQQADAMMEARK